MSSPSTDADGRSSIVIAIECEGAATGGWQSAISRRIMT